MTQLTRRTLFGLGAAGAAAACTATPAPSARAATGAVSFDHGVASGDPNGQSVVVWTRVTPEQEEAGFTVKCLASYDAAKFDLFDAASDNPVSDISPDLVVEAQTSAARDYTVKLELAATPGAIVHYAFLVKGPNGYVMSPIGQTKLFNTDDTKTFTAAVVSCSNYPFGLFNGYKAIAARDELDAVIHLGDYLYEYGPDGYGGEVGAALGREHAPAKEIVSLQDYRERHAQYKSDPDLQAAHAAAPWFCGWDDHESTNNSYRTGAQNHQPETEGDWTARKTAAVQAYLEWMPVRDPSPGRAREAIYRSFDIGGLATLVMLESRLVGRSDELSYSVVAELPREQAPAKLMEIVTASMSPERTMLGAEQEAWVAETLSESVASGKTWQVIGNQVIMAKVKSPNLAEGMSAEQMDALFAESPFLKPYVELSTLGVPLNLDAWDGFAAARERLYAAAKTAGAKLVTLTGDTHTAWANELHDSSGDARGVEFGCTSITSPGFGDLLPIENFGSMMSDANREVKWYSPNNRGFTVLTLSETEVRGEFVALSTITDAAFETKTDAVFVSEASEEGPAPLRQAT